MAGELDRFWAAHEKIKEQNARTRQILERLRAMEPVGDDIAAARRASFRVIEGGRS